MERLSLALIEGQRKGRKKGRREGREDGKESFGRSIRDEPCIRRKFQHICLEGLEPRDTPTLVSLSHTDVD